MGEKSIPLIPNLSKSLNECYRITNSFRAELHVEKVFHKEKKSSDRVKGLVLLT